MSAKPTPAPQPYLVPKEVWDRVPLIISTMPRELGDFPTDEDVLGAWITTQLDSIMGAFLIKDNERELWAQRVENGLPDLLWARMDKLIIQQTENLGDLIEHSKIVEFRIQRWKVEQEGEELYARYNRARDKHMRHLHRRGGALPPIDPLFKQFKIETVRELRIVLQDLQGHFAEALHRVTTDELIARFRHKVAQSDCEGLQGNQLSWETFLSAQTRHQNVESLIKRKAAPLFDEWAAWATTYKPEVLRQKISRQKL